MGRQGLTRIAIGGAGFIGIAARLTIADGHQIVNLGAPAYTVGFETKRR